MSTGNISTFPFLQDCEIREELNEKSIQPPEQRRFQGPATICVSFSLSFCSTPKMSLGNAKIIRFESGWEEEIKVKVRHHRFLGRRVPSSPRVHLLGFCTLVALSHTNKATRQHAPHMSIRILALLSTNA